MIFEDTTGKRWRGTRKAFAAFGLAIGFGVVNFIAGAVTAPMIASADNVPVDFRIAAVEQPLTLAPAKPAAALPAALPHATVAPFERTREYRSLKSLPFIHSAFLLQDEPASVQSLYRHLDQLQVVFPDWLNFATADGKIDLAVNAELAAKLRASGVMVMPRLANAKSGQGWFEDGLPSLFRDADVTDMFIDNLVAHLEAVQADGVNIDIEGLQMPEQQAYVSWLETVTSVLHEHGLTVTVDIPLNDEAYDYESIGKVADAVVLMAYDQNYDTSAAGPIAARDWYEGGLAEVATRIAPDKLIAGIGAYGYNWTDGEKTAEDISFRAANQLASQYGERITASEPDVNSHFSFRDMGGRRHQVWLLDAISAWTEYSAAHRAAVRGVALWRTGQEDETLWSFYRNRKPDEPAFDPESLTVLPAENVVNFRGDGEMLRVQSKPQPGHRNLSIDGTSIDAATTTSTPLAFDVQRFGRTDSKTIALTFDDGPDPKWTPAVLATLAKYNVPAAFFVIGADAQKYPAIVDAAFRAGHLIGNHTFHHPELWTLDAWSLQRELATTERTIESITGHSTVLFRSPYEVGVEPTSPDQLLPLVAVTAQGYITSRAGIDSVDFSRPGVDRIVANVVDGLADPNMHVVLMHDGGGDRSQTIAALDKLIPLLQGQGYSFVGLDAIAGTPVAVLMPKLAASESALMPGLWLEMLVREWAWTALQALFALSTGVALFRIVMLGGLIYAGRNRKAVIDPTFAPPVRVLVPAYNEAKVIERTLETLMKSDYPHFTVSVIDDGSKDETAEIVGAFAAREPRVTLICQANAGKSAALNSGMAEATEEYVVTIDADTIIFPHTIRKLVEPFADPKVDAVCGNVQVGNVHNMLTAFQNIEYVTSQNYDRRAFDVLNCISVVPGATGAWRRAKVLEVGGYAHSTLTEDADMTFAMLAAGARITYAPDATSATEAPETIAALFRQRFRWSFGTFQCFWKHRRQLGKGTLGLVAMPNMLLFQFLFPLLAPIGDALLLYCLWRGDFSPVALGYLTFLAMDLIGAVVAFILDRRPPAMAWVILVQRFYYRQFLYVVTLAAVMAVLRGGRRGWNKLQRTGSVGLPYGRRAGDEAVVAA